MSNAEYIPDGMRECMSDAQVDSIRVTVGLRSGYALRVLVLPAAVRRHARSGGFRSVSQLLDGCGGWLRTLRAALAPPCRHPVAAVAAALAPPWRRPVAALSPASDDRRVPVYWRKA
jgi:hypothetical protein